MSEAGNSAGRFVIVGGGPAGLSAARAYREVGGDGEVTLLSEEDFPPYRRPPLTKEYLRDEVPKTDLPMEDENWYAENGVNLVLEARVASLDRDRRVVVRENGEEHPYDACVLATGSEPLRPPVPGADDPEVRVMRSVEDSDGLAEKASSGTKVLVVGSGFIGCEAAASLSMCGAEVVQVSLEDLPQETRLGGEAGGRIVAWLEERGVDLRHGRSIRRINRVDGGFETEVEGRESFRSDVVLLAAGVEARTRLALDSGLGILSGGVSCDSSMRASDTDIFAVGDISYAFNEAAGRSLRVEHWGDALEHGRIAGTVAAGGEARWRSVPGFWSTIGDRILKYAAWGDGWDESRFVDHGGGAFTVWYGLDGVCVGVLSHERDEDYERGRELIEAGASLPE